MALKTEQDYLNLIDKHFPRKLDTMLDSVELGRGDDCAILRSNGFTCISSDLFLDTIHFRRSYFEPQEIGHKALAVNLSDIAGMGGVPRAFTLDLMIPKGLDQQFWDHFFAGMAALAHEHETVLVGGDLSQSPQLGMSVHIWGEPAPCGRLLQRGGAHSGDLLVVAGQLGLARVGLLSLESKGREAIQDYPAATTQHLRPHPRVQDGLALASCKSVRGLMDISDGLARDLPRFLSASGGLGADITLAPTALHPEVISFAEQQNKAPELVAMLGGEDYALLAAIAPYALQEMQQKIPTLQVIGVVIKKSGITLNDKPFISSGFDHFSQQD